MDYERYIFRLIQQESEEPFDSFVSRLSCQAQNCNFADFSSQMKDQIIDKSLNANLREKAFAANMTLDQIIYTGRTLEAATRNCRSNNYYTAQAVTSSEQICGRCGFSDHIQTSTKCPAWKAKKPCILCNIPGHYARMCRTSKKIVAQNENKKKSQANKLTANKSASKSEGSNKVDSENVHNTEQAVSLERPRKIPRFDESENESNKNVDIETLSNAELTLSSNTDAQPGQNPPQTETISQ